MIRRKHTSVRPRKKNKKAKIAAAAGGYIAYLDAFPQSDARVDILQNLADTLNEAGNPLEAGRRAFEAATLLAEGPKTPDAAAPAEGDKKDEKATAN